MRFNKLRLVLGVAGLFYAAGRLAPRHLPRLGPRYVPAGAEHDVHVPSPVGPARSHVGWWVAGIVAVVAIAAAVAYGITARSEQRQVEIAEAVTGGTAARAPEIMRRYGCGSCHTIPGVPGANGKVATSLENLRQRVFIAGVLRNSPDNLVSWIVSPQSFIPNNAMPATGITDAEARDVAAYLYSH